jgi:hypothetical protein
VNQRPRVHKLALPCHRIASIAASGRWFRANLILSTASGKTVVGGLDPSHADEMSGLSLASVLGLLAAVLSALGTNLSFLFKHRGAVAAADVDVRHLVHSAVELFRSKWWTIGWSIAVVASAMSSRGSRG